MKTVYSLSLGKVSALCIERQVIGVWHETKCFSLFIQLVRSLPSS